MTFGFGQKGQIVRPADVHDVPGVCLPSRIVWKKEVRIKDDVADLQVG